MSILDFVFLLLIFNSFIKNPKPSLYASLMHYYMLMKQDNKTRTYMFIGIPGSGKSNVLFKFLRQRILEEKRCDNSKKIEQSYEVLSFNDFNICAGERCRKICRMMSVPCKTEISKAPEDYSYSPDKTYFVDTSGNLGKQKSVYDFFSKSVFAAKCFLAVPAIIDLQILSGILEQYSFLKDFQVVLTFCDFANDERMKQISEFFESRKIRIAARNNSSTIDGSLEFL